VLPIFRVGSRRRRCLLSGPFGVEGGVCAADPSAVTALDAAAVDLLESERASYVELRDGRHAPGFQVREGRYFGFRKKLSGNEPDDFAAIPRKQRRMIRVARKHGLQARCDVTDLAIFYDLYARSVRRLGSPVFSRRYFQTLVDEFPDSSLLLTVRHNGRPLAAVLSFFFNDTVMPYYAGSRPEAFRLAANDFMYWELLRTALERGARVFDFGRSKKGTGAFDFKRHWGFEPRPLRYRVRARDGAPLPDRASDDPRLQLLRAAWRRLPLPVTRVLGPHILARYGAYYT